MGGVGGAAGRAQARAAARQQGYGGGAQGYGGGGMQGAAGYQAASPMPATDGQLTARVNFLEQSNQQRDANISEVMARDDDARSLVERFDIEPVADFSAK